MRKVALPMTWILVIALILISNSNAVADVITPINPQMQQNLQDMSKLMASISNELSTGKMSREAQEAAASVTKQVSQILQELSEEKRVFDDQKKVIDQMKESWQPFTADALTED